MANYAVLINYQFIFEKLEYYKLTVCWRERTISHPGYTSAWPWGSNGMTFAEAFNQAMHDIGDHL
jgi:hypothetical protein